MTILKQTVRQAKAAYRQTNDSLSEREIQRLENLAAADRRAEALREKEKRRKEAKKRQKDKERRERDARRRNGIGDATQACGWSLTQRRQKDWFRTYLRKDQPKAALMSKSGDDSHFKSSQVFPSETPESQGRQLGDGVHNDGSRTNGSALNHGEDAKPDSLVHNEGCGIFDSRREDLICRCVHHSDSITTCDAGACPNGLDNTRFPDNGPGVPGVGHAVSEPYRVDCTSDRPNLASTSYEPNPWSTDEIDEESLLAAVQGQTPNSKASISAPYARSGEGGYDGDLPSIDAEMLAELISDSQIARDIATPVGRQPCHALSDNFLSSELDLSAEELAALDRSLQEAQRPSPEAHHVADSPGKVHEMDQSTEMSHANPVLPSSESSLVESMPQAQKRKVGALNDDLVPSPKQRETPPPGPVLTDCNSYMPLVADVSRQHDLDGKQGGSDTVPDQSSVQNESRFAAYGLSTQLIQEAALDEFDF